MKRLQVLFLLHIFSIQSYCQKQVTFFNNEEINLQSSTRYLAKTNNGFFFNGFSKETGVELWFTDGSKEGTYLVRDLNPGEKSSQIIRAIAFKDKLYFQINNELWHSDGTEKGTVKIFSGDGSFKDLFVIEERLFFSNTNPEGLDLFEIKGKRILPVSKGAKNGYLTDKDYILVRKDEIEEGSIILVSAVREEKNLFKLPISEISVFQHESIGPSEAFFVSGKNAPSWGDKKSFLIYKRGDSFVIEENVAYPELSEVLSKTKDSTILIQQLIDPDSLKIQFVELKGDGKIETLTGPIKVKYPYGYYTNSSSIRGSTPLLSNNDNLVFVSFASSFSSGIVWIHVYNKLKEEYNSFKIGPRGLGANDLSDISINSNGIVDLRIIGGSFDLNTNEFSPLPHYQYPSYFRKSDDIFSWRGNLIDFRDEPKVINGSDTTKLLNTNAKELWNISTSITEVPNGALVARYTILNPNLEVWYVSENESFRVGENMGRPLENITRDYTSKRDLDNFLFTYKDSTIFVHQWNDFNKSFETKTLLNGVKSPAINRTGRFCLINVNGRQNYLFNTLNGALTELSDSDKFYFFAVQDSLYIYDISQREVREYFSNALLISNVKEIENLNEQSFILNDDRDLYLLDGNSLRLIAKEVNYMDNNESLGYFMFRTYINYTAKQFIYSPKIGSVIEVPYRSYVPLIKESLAVSQVDQEVGLIRTDNSQYILIGEGAYYQGYLNGKVFYAQYNESYESVILLAYDIESGQSLEIDSFNSTNFFFEISFNQIVTGERIGDYYRHRITTIGRDLSVIDFELKEYFREFVSPSIFRAIDEKTYQYSYWIVGNNEVSKVEFPQNVDYHLNSWLYSTSTTGQEFFELDSSKIIYYKELVPGSEGAQVFDKKFKIGSKTFLPASTYSHGFQVWELELDKSKETLFQSDFNFVIYPNPAEWVFPVNIRSNQQSSIYIYNSKGHLVKELPKNFNHSLDIMSWPKGVYIIKAVNEKGEWVSKRLVIPSF